MKKYILLSSFLFVLFAKCANAYEFPDKITIDKDFTVAKIGNEEVKMSEITVYASRLNKFLKDNFINSPEWRFNFIKEIVIRKSLEKYAVKQELDKNEDVKFQIENAKTQVLSNAVLSRELSDKFNITAKDKEKYYEENKASFTDPLKIKVRHIQLADRKKGENVLNRLKKGESFSGIAKEISEDENTKNNGGLLNDYLSKDMPPMEIQGITPEIMVELLNLKKGDVSRLIQADNKYHIFQIEEIIPESLKPYSEVKQQVDTETEKKLKDKIISQLLEKIGKELSVTINETEIKKDLSQTQKK